MYVCTQEGCYVHSNPWLARTYGLGVRTLCAGLISINLIRLLIIACAPNLELMSHSSPGGRLSTGKYTSIACRSQRQDLFPCDHCPRFLLVDSPIPTQLSLQGYSRMPYIRTPAHTSPQVLIFTSLYTFRNVRLLKFYQPPLPVLIFSLEMGHS